MPPNPRDRLKPGDRVPRGRIEEAVADALYRPENRGQPYYRRDLAVKVVDKLLYFRVLAPDVEGMDTGAHQRHLSAAGWMPPHRLDRLKEYVEALRDAGALVEAGIITEIINGGDPEYG